MVGIKLKGKFSKASKRLLSLKNSARVEELEKYAQMGVDALSAATPIKTGKTAASWGYKIVFTEKAVKIVWINSNVQNGVNVAIILQYDHVTPSGGFVKGRNYINPAIKPVMDEIAANAWKEVKRL